MKYTTHNEEHHIDINMTHLLDYVDCSYDKGEQVFSVVHAGSRKPRELTCDEISNEP